MDIRDLIQRAWPDWTPEGMIGGGPHGSVWLARRGNVESAVKVVTLPRDQEDLNRADRAVRGLTSEMKVLQTMNSYGNLLPIEDCATVEGDGEVSVLIRTPFATPLSQLSLSGEAEVVQLGIDLCAALAACRSRGVTHRDIKPENIFANPRGGWMLGDFGMARWLGAVESPWSAPEAVAPADAAAAGRADICSVGLLLYGLLNNGVIDRPLTRPANASGTLPDILARACATVPTKRYATADEMKKALSWHATMLPRVQAEKAAAQAEINAPKPVESRFGASQGGDRADTGKAPARPANAANTARQTDAAWGGRASNSAARPAAPQPGANSGSRPVVSREQGHAAQPAPKTVTPDTRRAASAPRTVAPARRDAPQKPQKQSHWRGIVIALLLIVIAALAFYAYRSGKLDNIIHPKPSAAPGMEEQSAAESPSEPTDNISPAPKDTATPEPTDNISPAPKDTATPEPVLTVTVQPAAEAVVYYNDPGKRYHTQKTCSGMNTADAHTLAEAVEAGKQGCSVCGSPDADLLNQQYVAWADADGRFHTRCDCARFSGDWRLISLNDAINTEHLSACEACEADIYAALYGKLASIPTPTPTPSPSPTPTSSPTPTPAVGKVEAPVIYIDGEAISGIAEIRRGYLYFSWNAEGEVDHYSMKITDPDGHVVSKQDNSLSGGRFVNTIELEPGMVYTVAVSATPVNGGNADTVWSEAQFNIAAPASTEPTLPPETPKPAWGALDFAAETLDESTPPSDAAEESGNDSASGAIAAPEAPTFRSPAIEAAARSALGKSTGDISFDELATIEALDLRGKDLDDISDLAMFTGLRSLDISENHINNLGPLSGLDRLEWLSIGNNDIDDLSPLSGLYQLEWLSISENDISDLSPLSGLVNLRTLRARENRIESLEPLRRLVQLNQIDLLNNRISDLEPLAGLTQLNFLQLYGNRAADLTPLAGLTSLQDLYLSNNDIRDISPLSGLTALEYLSLDSNEISDVRAMSKLTGLKALWLSNNNISSALPLSGLKQLEYLHLENNPIKTYTPVQFVPNLFK